MKDLFGEFIPKTLGQATPPPAPVAAPTTGLRAHLIWMVLSGGVGAFVSWKACRWYTNYKQLLQKAKKTDKVDVALRKK